MQSFHRTRRDSRILVFAGLGVALLLSVIFMLVGFMGIGESGFDPLRVIFGVAGICLLVIFMRGGWMATGGALVHVFSIDETEIEWGYAGREKRMAVSEIEEIYWSATDGFTFVITRKDGSRVRFPFMQNVIPPKSRGELRAFLRSVHPGIRVREH